MQVEPTADEIGFIYQGMTVQHGADGVTSFILEGQTLTGQSKSLQMDATSVKVAKLDTLKSGDWISYFDFQE